MTDSREKGKIIELRGQLAFVQVIPSEICNSCNARRFCRPGDLGDRIIKASNRISAEIGQFVEIEENSHLLLLLATMQFGLPLAGLLAGILSATALNLTIPPFPTSLLQFFSGMAGLFIAGCITRMWSVSFAQKERILFEITAVLPMPIRASAS